MNPSFKAEAVVGAGRGALIAAMFGSGWLGWGLGDARAFNVFVGPAFGSVELFLLACSIYVIRKGRQLRKQHSPVPSATRKAVRKSFLLVVRLEFVAAALLGILAWRLHRPYLAADWCAMVVGLHFLPLAKIFRAPHYNVIGVLITLWSVLCWTLFRSNALFIAVAVGTGVLLWSSSILSLLRARKVARSLRSLSASGSLVAYDDG
jgi:hypothetical protein